MTWQIVKLLIKIVNALLFYLCLMFNGTPIAWAQQAPLVEVARVEAWEGGAEHILHCIVQSNDIYQLTSHSQARLLWVLPPGSKVEKDQLIAEQDSYYLETSIEQLKLQLESAKAQEAYAQQEYARVQSLSHSKLVSSSRLNDMERLARQSKLDRQSIESQLRESLYRLEHTKHYASQSGQILHQQARLGENLSDGDKILTLLPADKRELTCELPIAKFRESQSLSNVSFYTLDGTPLVLKRFNQALIPQSQSVNLYLQAQTDFPLLLEERLQVITRYHHSAVVRLPYDAVELSEKEAYVWHVDSNNQVSRTPINIVKTQPEHVLVKSSLTPGEMVITIGKQGLIEEQKVTINMHDSADAMGGAR